jgi:hypothetical protein
MPGFAIGHFKKSLAFFCAAENKSGCLKNGAFYGAFTQFGFVPISEHLGFGGKTGVIHNSVLEDKIIFKDSFTTDFYHYRK